MENDNLAAIGIGAMIVFIALILVAAVAAAVIIQTAEKLQQNAQSTGDDTTDEMSGKVQILNVFVDDPDNSYVVYFRLAAGSDDTAANDILWQVFCEDAGNSTTDRIAGEFDDTPGDGGTSIIFELSDSLLRQLKPQLPRLVLPTESLLMQMLPAVHLLSKMTAALAQCSQQRSCHIVRSRCWWRKHIRGSESQRRFSWSSGGLSLPVQ